MYKEEEFVRKWFIFFNVRYFFSSAIDVAFVHISTLQSNYGFQI